MPEGLHHLAGRIGGLRVHQTNDSKAIAARARRGQFQRWLDQARDEHPEAPDAELERLAKLKQREHMARLALASAKARRQRSGGGADAAVS